jgi:hypothetical protein
MKIFVLISLGLLVLLLAACDFGGPALANDRNELNLSKKLSKIDSDGINSTPCFTNLSPPVAIQCKSQTGSKELVMIRGVVLPKQSN